MLSTDLADHRRSGEQALLAALRVRDPLALAEAYHRTAPAAYACARRLLGSATEIEGLLREVYGELWVAPPEDGPLEGWVRSRCFAWGAAHLRDAAIAPAAPSLADLLPDLAEAPQGTLDTAEEVLAGLDQPARLALLEAHDRGVASASQSAPTADDDLRRALLALCSAAGGDNGADDDPQARECELAGLGDWALGLLDPRAATQLASDLADDGACAALARRLQRGRRLLEGLPPTPDLGQRVLVAVLAATGADPDHGLPSALDPQTVPEPPAGAADPPARSAARGPRRVRPSPPGAERRPEAPRPARPARPPLRAKPGTIPSDQAGSKTRGEPEASDAGPPADSTDAPLRRRRSRALLVLGVIAVIAGAAILAAVVLDLGL
ncbi:MAG TPA: hypothetical protein VML96_12940 [Egibacteraceae bacterium]|nr:hypothetical protein [Egibacteraceae bacterium]